MKSINIPLHIRITYNCKYPIKYSLRLAILKSSLFLSALQVHVVNYYSYKYTFNRIVIIYYPLLKRTKLKRIVTYRRISMSRISTTALLIHIQRFCRLLQIATTISALLSLFSIRTISKPLYLMIQSKPILNMFDFQFFCDGRWSLWENCIKCGRFQCTIT